MLEKMIRNKILVITGSIVGAAFLIGGGYAAGKFFAGKKHPGNFVRLEDGRQMRLKNQGPFSNGQRPDMMGRIKSIDGNTIVLEKFAMPSRASREDGSSGDDRQARGERPNQEGGLDSEADSGPRNGSGPQLQVEGEETITLADNAEILKNARSLERGLMHNRESNSEPEEISASDLRQGDMITVWLSEGQDKVVEKIMVRGTGSN